MKASVSVKQISSNAAAIRKAVAALTDQDVYIGIPADKNAPRQGANNAELGYIHEFGAPAANIPARPHLIPGIGDVQPQAAELLETAGKKALKGDEAAVERALNKIGHLAANAVKARFVNNEWPPLSDAYLDRQPLLKDEDGNAITDKKGRPQHGKSKREKGRVNPLIDTGQLRKAYTYVIRKRGAKLIAPEEQ